MWVFILPLVGWTGPVDGRILLDSSYKPEGVVGFGSLLGKAILNKTTLCPLTRKSQNLGTCKTPKALHRAILHLLSQPSSLCDLKVLRYFMTELCPMVWRFLLQHWKTIKGLYFALHSRLSTAYIRPPIALLWAGMLQRHWPLQRTGICKTIHWRTPLCRCCGTSLLCLSDLYHLRGAGLL